MAGTVTRSFSSSAVAPGSSVDVTLTVDVDGESYYVIDEVYPNGWTVTNNGGGNAATSGHLKWVVVSGTSDTSYTYRLSVPDDTSGMIEFTGTYAFQGGSNIPVSGSSSVTVSNSEDCVLVPATCSSTGISCPNSVETSMVECPPGSTCTEGVCVVNAPSPTCSDEILNQDETGVDCGGETCPACAVPAADESARLTTLKERITSVLSEDGSLEGYEYTNNQLQQISKIAKALREYFSSE